MTGGKKHHNFKDLTGQRFGMLVALRPSHSDGKRWYWELQCDCGETCKKQTADLSAEMKRGGTPNCGCATKRLISKANSKHGMTKHPAYAVYRSMIDRCRLPTHQAWKNYGGRGISVCSRWQESFVNFWEDMGPSYQKGLTLERLDNELDYSPDNCQWVSMRDQTMNKRTSVRCADIPQLSKETGIAKSTLYYRAKKGQPLTTPPDKRKATKSTTS